MNLSVHKAFFEKTSQLSTELSKIEHAVKEQEKELINKVKTVVFAVKKIAENCRDENEVEKAIQANLHQISQVIVEWQNKLDRYNTNLAFRKDFGDSFLVFVYGKVKAGKSSLGNYVATGRENPDENWLNNLPDTLHKPEFFSEKVNENFGEIINYDTGFAVGASETTSCIQGFRVPGFTWVDSPGLHSVTEANGDLAKQYAESADLIIYPMNSAQPARRTDLEELEKLILANKRILLLITRCDTLEIDLDDDDNIIESVVMKADKNRQAQESYVKAELDNICNELAIENIDTDAITISVKYAENGGNSEQAMAQAGLTKFFNTLGHVIKSEAVTLKKQVPAKNLQAFYSTLLSDDSELSISRINQPLQSAIKTIQELERELFHQTEQIQSSIELAFSFELDALVEQFAEQRDIKSLNQKVDQFINQSIITDYQPVIKKICENAVGSMAKLTSSMSFDSAMKFEDKKIQVEIDVSTRYAAIGSGVGGVLGGLIGSVVPVIGTMIGATVGSIAGGAAGKFISSKELVNIVSGDNREEIKQSLLIAGNKAIEKRLFESRDNLRSSLFSPMQQAFCLINNQTSQLENYIKGQVRHV